jgi:hypothetical protein
MTFGETLLSYFTGYPGIAALISTRMYPTQLPQEPTLPALTYQRVGGEAEYSHGSSAARSPHIQFTCWAATYLACEALSLQVIAAADAWHDAMGGAAFADDPIDMSEPNTGVYQIVVDVLFRGAT